MAGHHPGGKCPHPDGTDESYHNVLIMAYNIVLIIGLALNIIILFVAYLSSRVQRSYAWFMFIISWIILSLSYLSLVGHQTGPQPQHGFCVTQAILIYAAPPLTAFATLVFVIDLYFSFWIESGHSTKWKTWLLLLPPSIYVVVAISALLACLTHPELISRDRTGMYCHTRNKIPSIVNLVLIGSSVIIILVFEVALIFLLRVHWSAFLHLRKTNTTTRGVSLGIIIRLSLFTVAPLFVFVIELVIIPDSLRCNGKAMSISGLLFAVLPLFAALTFGTQHDIICALGFWRKQDDLSEKPQGEIQPA